MISFCGTLYAESDIIYGTVHVKQYGLSCRFFFVEWWWRGGWGLNSGFVGLMRLLSRIYGNFSLSPANLPLGFPFHFAKYKLDAKMQTFCFILKRQNVFILTIFFQLFKKDNLELLIWIHTYYFFKLQLNLHTFMYFYEMKLCSKPYLPDHYPYTLT